MEFLFSFTVYPLDADQAAKLREQLQELILVEVENQNLYMGPLVVQEVDDGKGETD